jgi:plasmid stabilization system protein ParE
LIGEAAIGAACDARPAEIAEYLRTHKPSAALAVRDAILRSLQNLALFPGIGHPQNVDGVRKLVTPRYRYLIYYTIDNGPRKS